MIVDCGIYDGGVRRAGHFTFEQAYEASKGSDTFVWLGLYEPTPEEFASVKTAFELHELAVEDALKAHQRPKLEVYDDTLFIVVKTARYVDSEEVVTLGELLLFVGRELRRRRPPRRSEPARRDAASASRSVPSSSKCGPGAVLWAILDHVVDDYLPVLEGLEHDIDQVENEVFSPGKENPAERIYFLKREVMEFLRGVRPLRDPLDRLARGTLPLLHEDIRPYFRDVNDHLVRVVEQLEGDRDLLTSILQSNLTQVSIRQNEDMRKISSWAAIFAVPTMIAGIYGMNFQHMPELKSPWGYPFALGLMLVVCARPLPRLQAIGLAVGFSSPAAGRRRAHRVALLAVGGDPAFELRPLLRGEDRVDLALTAFIFALAAWPSARTLRNAAPTSAGSGFAAEAAAFSARGRFVCARNAGPRPCGRRRSP